MILALMVMLDVRGERGTQKMIWITPKERMAFLERHFHSLNRFTKRHSIPLAVNKKISHAIGRIVVGDEETGIQQ